MFACLSLLSPTAAGAAVQARVVPELTAGAGWADDTYPGAEFGAHGQTVFAPGLGFDVSTGPVVKLLSRYRYLLSSYLRDGAGNDVVSEAHDAELTTRFRLGAGLDLDVPVSVGYLDGTAPVKEDLPAGVTLRWLEVGPLVRWRLDPVSRVEAGVALQLSELALERRDAGAGEEAWDERSWSAFVGGSRRLRERVEVALRYEHVAVASDHADGDHDQDRSSDAVVAAVAVAPWRELVARGSAGVEHVRYPSYPRADGPEPARPGLREDLRQVFGVSASHPIGDHLDAELSLSWTTTSSNLSLAEGDRFSSWLGLRAELPYWL